jgi:uncharacterized damage-inducible protein DinB
LEWCSTGWLIDALHNEESRVGGVREILAMQVSEYRSLLLHMEWADALIWQSVLSAPPSGQDDSMLARLHHFHSTQWAYLQVLRSQPVEVPEVSGFPDLRSLSRWARQFYRELPAFLDALDEAKLSRTVEFPWAAQVASRLGTAGPATVGESVLQLVLHTTYHRGQISTRLRERGVEPPLTDFIAWIWMQRPAARWGTG